MQHIVSQFDVHLVAAQPVVNKHMRKDVIILRQFSVTDCLLWGLTAHWTVATLRHINLIDGLAVVRGTHSDVCKQVHTCLHHRPPLVAGQLQF